MKFKFQNATFLTTAVKPGQFPSFGTQPEIAVVGRSNVGKSTLLNHLFRSKNLVKTSSTPGKTQAVNFFHLDEALVFADLPGYGYAKVPAHERKKWAPLIESYLAERPSMILFLLDIRRTPNADDLQMLSWIEASGIPAIVVLTKVDKVKRSERARQTKQILSRINNTPHVHYSAVKNEGRNQLMHKICEVLD
ncbi:MAG: putative GTP-binding protein EngB [Chlamydiales bacterium]|nr:putative GTP-binding protein EngB [Chlamydiales bacterium]